MVLELVSVDENMYSVLKLDEYAIGGCKKINERINFLEKTPKDLQSDIKEIIQKRFSNIIQDYLLEKGLIKDEKDLGEGKRFYLRKDSEKEPYYLKLDLNSVNILPKSEGTQSVHGFRPSMKFYLDSPKTLKISSTLDHIGAYFLNVMPDLLKASIGKCDEKNGMVKPKLRVEKNEDRMEMQIASIEQTPFVIEESKRLVKSIGQEELEELWSLKKNANKGVCNFGFEHNMKEKYSQAVLNALDIKFF